jgi:hypothetical protein
MTDANLHGLARGPLAVVSLASRHVTLLVSIVIAKYEKINTVHFSRS